MKRSWLFPIASALCLVTAAFAGSDDGQSLAAKPGMARLYLIQGDMVKGPVPVGAAVAGRAAHRNDPPFRADPAIPLLPRSQTGRRDEGGRICRRRSGSGQYELKLCLGLRDCVVFPLQLAEGQVAYMVADADVPNGPILEVCHQACGDRVLQGHQIDAFPKPGSNIPNF